MTNMLPRPLVSSVTTGGVPVNITGHDIYVDTVSSRYHDSNDGTIPGEAVLVGMSERHWISLKGEYLLPQDVRLFHPTRVYKEARPPFQFDHPLVCLGGVEATGWDGLQWDTSHGKQDYLVGPVIDPLPPVDEARIARLLGRVPEIFLDSAHRQLLRRHAAIDQDLAHCTFGVHLPELLLFEWHREMLCPVGAFARWYLGFSADDVAVLHVPENVEYQGRLESLACEQTEPDRRLWAKVQAGDEDARREYAERVAYLGDSGRAELLRGGLKKSRFRSIDDTWQSFDQEPGTLTREVSGSSEQTHKMPHLVNESGNWVGGPDPEFMSILDQLEEAERASSDSRVPRDAAGGVNEGMK